jgi:hypothetical protein
MLTALVATTYAQREWKEPKQQAEVCGGLSRLQLVVLLSAMLLLFLLLLSISDL